jgi:hypothetical protein
MNQRSALAPSDQSAVSCAGDHATGSREEMGRLLRNLTPLVAARRGAAVLAPALLLTGCFGSKTPAGHAADYARAIAGMQGLAVESVNCSPRGTVSWTCAGRLKSGRRFICSVGPTGREFPAGTCTVRAIRP